MTQHKTCRFGTVTDDEMVLNNVGIMINQLWLNIPKRFDGIALDIYQIMPNHIHGIICVINEIKIHSVGASLVGARSQASLVGASPSNSIQEKRVPTRGTPTIGDVIGAFKSETTYEYIQNVKHEGWPRFDKQLWQRNFYEHVIRNDQDLNRIREYIVNNPSNWETDDENPNRKTITKIV